MSRNKYPEQTKQKILEVSGKLFIEKGYENTSLNDITEAINMSKGAIYHHFESKEEILLKFIETYFNDIGWFTDILKDQSLNGLEKLRKIFIHELGTEEKIKVDSMSFHTAINNPKLIMAQIHASVQEVAPFLAGVIEEGNRDGSLNVAYPKEASELLILIINMWFNQGLFPTGEQELLNKIMLVSEVLTSIGLPIFDDKMLDIAINYFKSL